MQAAKDTFLKTLASRLSVVNPDRTVMLDGASRPAVIAEENETPMPANAAFETFVLSWGDAGKASIPGSLMFMDYKLRYASKGTDALLRADRGRVVTAMDRELMRICEPRSAAKCDYTQTSPSTLGTNIFWTLPMLADLNDENGALLRTATMRVYFFPEVG